MEVLVPIIGLGGLYIISNQNDKSKEQKAPKRGKVKEGFSATPALVSVDENEKSKKGEEIEDIDVMRNEGINGNQMTPATYRSAAGEIGGAINGIDIYYGNAAADIAAATTPGIVGPNEKFTSLSGKTMNVGELKHNNMTPFFGSHARSPYVSTETRLDHLAGSGSQMIKKEEQAPLFKPSEHTSNVYGNRVETDFIQSRMNQSHMMNGVKPFQEVKVGPSLDRSGDGTSGTGGFNSGMQHRDMWMPKNVDELRVATKKKESYGGVVLAGKAPITNRGQMGQYEKHQPDTYYLNGPERYFYTGGEQRKATHRSIELMKEQGREVSRQHFGNSGRSAELGSAPYVKGKYETPKTQQLESTLKYPQAVNLSKNAPKQNDPNLESFKKSQLPNNRSTTSQPRSDGFIGSLVKAITSPITDALRHTKKDNVVGNVRGAGNAGTTESHANIVRIKGDRAKTTIREMTERRPDHMFVGNQAQTHLSGDNRERIDLATQERETTSTEYFGARGNTGNGSMTNYGAAYNAQLIDKTSLVTSRAPKGSSVKVFTGVDHQGQFSSREISNDLVNRRTTVPQLNGAAGPAVTSYGQNYVRHSNTSTIGSQRIDPVFVSALKTNPYAKPIGSIA